MLRVLAFLVPLVVAVYSVVDCVQTPEGAVKGLPKVVWVFVILLFPLAGAAAWWLAGRPVPIGHLPGQPPAAGHVGREQRRPKGPDDDPDFLRNL